MGINAIALAPNTTTNVNNEGQSPNELFATAGIDTIVKIWSVRCNSGTF